MQCRTLNSTLQGLRHCVRRPCRRPLTMSRPTLVRLICSWCLPCTVRSLSLAAACGLGLTWNCPISRPCPTCMQALPCIRPHTWISPSQPDSCTDCCAICLCYIRVCLHAAQAGWAAAQTASITRPTSTSQRRTGSGAGSSSSCGRCSPRLCCQATCMRGSTYLLRWHHCSQPGLVCSRMLGGSTVHESS